MAHINSIALGKAHGKLGNVIFQSYKNKVIARQCNTSISSQPSEKQIQQRQKLKVAGLAYNYLSQFLGDAVGIMKYGENMSSAFLRITQSQLPANVCISPIEAAGFLFGGIYGIASPFHILEFNLSGSVPTIKFNGQGSDFLPNTYANLFSWNEITGQQNHVVEELTESQWNSGTYVCSEMFIDYDAVACYIGNGVHHMVSEIYMQSN